MEYRRQAYVISTDRERLDLDRIHGYLSRESYWAQGRPVEVVKRSIEHSLCFGVFEREQQVGFARVVTDYATFAWLCDVFIVGSHRGRGLGKWLVASVAAHPDLAGLKLFLLATSNAHELYRRYGGFGALDIPEKWMSRTASPASAADC